MYVRVCMCMCTACVCVCVVLVVVETLFCIADQKGNDAQSYDGDIVTAKSLEYNKPPRKREKHTLQIPKKKKGKKKKKSTREKGKRTKDKQNETKKLHS